MKNKAFKQTFYVGGILFLFLFSLVMMIGVNLYNVITPKIDEYLNKKYVDTVPTSTEYLIMEVNLPEFDTIPKPIQSDSQPKIFVTPMVESKPKKTIKVDIPNNDTSSIRTNKTELVKDSVVKSF